jgi:hypothetical protein
MFEDQGTKGTENVPVPAKKRPVFRLRLGKNSMQGMLIWERLKKMCSKGKEVYQLLSAVQSAKSRSNGVCQTLIHPIPRPSLSVF